MQINKTNFQGTFSFKNIFNFYRINSNTQVFAWQNADMFFIYMLQFTLIYASMSSAWQFL